MYSVDHTYAIRVASDLLKQDIGETSDIDPDLIASIDYIIHDTGVIDEINKSFDSEELTESSSQLKVAFDFTINIRDGRLNIIGLKSPKIDFNDFAEYLKVSTGSDKVEVRSNSVSFWHPNESTGEIILGDPGIDADFIFSSVPEIHNYRDLKNKVDYVTYSKKSLELIKSYLDQK